MKLYIKKILSLLLITSFAITFAASVNAASITEQMIEGLKGRGGESIALEGLNSSGTGRVEVIAGRIIQAFLSIFGILFLGLMVYGGYKWMIAQGREEETKKAKDIIRSSIIGLAIVLSAYAISLFIINRFYLAAQAA